MTCGIYKITATSGEAVLYSAKDIELDLSRQLLALEADEPHDLREVYRQVGLDGLAFDIVEELEPNETMLDGRLHFWRWRYGLETGIVPQPRLMPLIRTNTPIDPLFTRRTLKPRAQVGDEVLREVVIGLKSGASISSIARKTGLDAALVGNIRNGRSHKARVEAILLTLKD